MASTTGRLQAFVALGKAPHLAVCHFPLDVLGTGLIFSTLESSRSSRDRHHEVRGGLRHLRMEGLGRTSIPVYLCWDATDRRTCTELQHTESGKSEFLTCGETMCFGNRTLINNHLSTDGYMDRRPLIPKTEPLASSVIHPAEHSMSWLLHTQRIPILPYSRSPASTELNSLCASRRL